jgi:uncharacterized membrane protein
MPMFGGFGWGGWILMSLVMMAFLLAVIWAIVYAVRGRSDSDRPEEGSIRFRERRKLFGRWDPMSGQPTAQGILRDRLARGDVDPAEFARRLAVLRQDRHRPRGSRRTLPFTITILLLLAGLSAGACARSRNHADQSTSACSVPSLPGSVVNVTLADMGGGMMGGTMRVVAQPSVVPAGEVSFRVVNLGSLTHELVVLPLPPGGAGSKAIGADGRVDEAGGLGEASATCGAGAGEGIGSRAAGWVTLRLAPGRYELLCNEPGHYAKGMYTVLDVQA